MTELEKFLEERSRVPIPGGDVARPKLMAKELALGVLRELWSPHIITQNHPNYPTETAIASSNMSKYFEERWGADRLNHHLDVLGALRYISRAANGREITEKAFALLSESEPYNIFISYRRMDSSALALLVLARLKEHGLEPFVDMALQAGGKWHADLEERIKACDYFIILLGKDTLESEVTVKEINWALQYESTIIPLWHRGFDSNDDRWSRIDKGALDTIQQTNAIIVQDESASGYNTAIVELLNRFGVTP